MTDTSLGKLTDASYVIEKVYQDYGFDYEINSAEVYEWIWDVMGLLGIPYAYIDKVTDGEGTNPDPIDIADYRGELPSDLYAVQLVREYTTKMPMICVESTFNEDGTYINVVESQYTYKLNNSYIFTSFEEGQVEILYKAFPTSPLGLPMIPDDVKYVRAVKEYIAERIAFRMMLSDRLTERKYDRIDQKKAWAISSARSHGFTPSVDKMEAIKNRFLRLKTNPNFHDASFYYSNEKERLILHNNLG